MKRLVLSATLLLMIVSLSFSCYPAQIELTLTNEYDKTITIEFWDTKYRDPSEDPRGTFQLSPGQSYPYFWIEDPVITILVVIPPGTGFICH